MDPSTYATKKKKKRLLLISRLDTKRAFAIPITRALSLVGALERSTRPHVVYLLLSPPLTFIRNDEDAKRENRRGVIKREMYPESRDIRADFYPGNLNFALSSNWTCFRREWIY